jgi:probable HAF family extracellular repeat protein
MRTRVLNSPASRSGLRVLACLAVATAAVPCALCFGQCEYEVTAIIEGEEICGFWGRAHVHGWDLTDRGVVVGEWHCLLGPNHAFIWRREGPPIDLPMPEGTNESEVAGVNEQGHCVGWLHNGVPGNAGHAFFCDGQTTQTFLPPPEGNYTTANAIGPDGTFVGQWGNTVQEEPGDQACVWREGQFMSLTPILGTPKSEAADINDSGLITGWMGEAMIHDAHGFILDGQEVLDIGVIAGGYTAVPKAINNCGEVCGYGMVPHEDPPGWQKHAFLWSEGEMTDLGLLPTFTRSLAYDLNHWTQVVGACTRSEQMYDTAFLWQNGAMFDLNDLVPPDFDVNLEVARAVNDEGQIIAIGIGNTGKTITVLLTPIDRPPSDLDCDCDTDLEDLEILLAHWGEAGGEADINHDDIVDVRDLLELLANWG